MSVLSHYIKSLKNNGVGGSVRILKNYIKNAKFNKLYSDCLASVKDDDGFTDYTPFDCDYQNNIDFSAFKTDVKPLAFYLPQFHTIPENDEWWGNGFTEWTNTKKATPKFNNHYQPRTPHKDIGYYDLCDYSVLKKQAELAKSHGIYGFCFYHYWFSGKRLLEKPVDLLLKHPEIDINFCLCWANENWTKTWDGMQSNILIKQNYLPDDANKFIDDLVPYINDPRYIKVNGKPVILIYNCAEIPKIKKVICSMRLRARQNGIGDILIWACRTHQSTAKTLKIENIIDAEVEFPPHCLNFDKLKINCIKTDTRSNIYNYQKLVSAAVSGYSKPCNKPVYRTVMMAWDNSCRRKDNYTVYYAYSKKSFYDWVLSATENARAVHSKENRFIFVNAFNEWAEGTYLEPDEKYGYANINTFSKALFSLPLKNKPEALQPADIENVTNEKIAVQIHISNISSLSRIITCINCIPFSFDCFISTDTAQKQQFIKNSFAQKCNCKNITLEVFENCTHSIANFISQLKNRYKNYSLVCHISSVKLSKGSSAELLEHTYSTLLGSEQKIAAVTSKFKTDENLGLVLPGCANSQISPAVLADTDILKKLNLPITATSDFSLPDGNMFWARTNAIKDVFELDTADVSEQTAKPLLPLISSYNGYETLEVYFD